MVKVKDDDGTPATVDSQWVYIEVVRYWATQRSDDKSVCIPVQTLKAQETSITQEAPGGGEVVVTIVAAWKYRCQVWKQEVGSSGFVVH